MARFADTYTFGYRASKDEACREVFGEYGDRLDEYAGFRYIMRMHGPRRDWIYLSLTPDHVRAWAKKNGMLV